MVIVREAEFTDAPAIAVLFGQLGYPMRTDGVVAQLSALDSGREVLLVAVDSGVVVGVACLSAVRFVYESALRARLTAIVVDERVRGAGTGTLLLHASEEWARAAGCTKIELTTHENRTRAHAFYRSRGYLQHVHFLHALTAQPDAQDETSV